MARMALDTRSQNSWKELIDKEAITRISWHQTFKPKPNDNEWFKRSFYTEAVSKPISCSLPPIAPPPQPKPRYDSNNSFDALLRRKIDLEHDPNEFKDMLPVKKEHIDVLFDGYSKEEKGRYKYLNLRKRIPLEERYQYPVTNSMAYGWKLGEAGQQFKAPTYARNKIVEESFYRRNGAFSFS
jgi:hypothetical protein